MVGPGQQRHPAIIILLFVVTLGVYWFVWLWKAFGEVERFKAADLKKAAFLVSMIILEAIVAIIAIYQAAVMIPEMLESIRIAAQGGTPSEPPPGLVPEYTPIMLASAAAQVIFYLLQLLYLRSANQLVLAALPPGWPGPSTTMVVLFNVAFILALVPLVGMLFGIAGLVLAIIWIVQVQQAMNRLWGSMVPPFAPPPTSFAPVMGRVP